MGLGLRRFFWSTQAMWKPARLPIGLVGAALTAAGCQSYYPGTGYGRLPDPGLPYPVRVESSTIAARGRALAAPAPLATTAQKPSDGLLTQVAHAEPAMLPPAETGPMPGKVIDGPTELSLDYVIQITMASSPDLQSALERTHAADATLARARADFFPTLALNGNYMGSNNPFNRFQYLMQQGEQTPYNLFFTPPATVDNLQSQVRMQQMLYTGGVGQARLQGAASERDAACHSLGAVQNQLTFQVTEAYYRLFQAGELIKVRQEDVALVERQLQTVQSRIKAGTAVKADLLQVEGRLATAREQLNTAINNQALARAVLENLAGARFAGLPLPTELPPAPWGEHAATVEAAVAQALAAENGAAVETAVAEALQTRPEVAQGQAQQEAALQRVKAIHGLKGPTIGLVGDYDLFTGSDGHSRGSFYAGLALSLNVFDGGRNKADVRQAVAQVREAIARNRRLHLDIELDVRRSYLQLKDARERLESTTSAIRTAQETLRQLEARYASQTGTLIDVLDGQVALSEVRIRQTTARADVEVARTALERAIGRLTVLLSPCAAAPAPMAAPPARPVH